VWTLQWTIIPSRGYRNNATVLLPLPTFKQRFSQHKSTFKHRKHINSTELSKYIWQLHNKKQDFNIKWSIISLAIPYNNISKQCNLCLTEKLMITKHSNDNLLNKRSELISKCRHENKFYLISYCTHAVYTRLRNFYLHTYCFPV